MNEIQRQLERMVSFIGNTPDPNEHHDWEWWIGPIPFALSPQEYAPEYVEDDGDKPIIAHWYDYLLKISDVDDRAMKAHLRRARHLRIGDLLVLSKEHASDYWRGAINHWESQYNYLLEER